MNLTTIRKAASAIAPFVHKTPLIRAHELEAHLQCKGRIFLKCEHLHITGSFKVRGAFNALLTLSSEEKKRGVITRSAGNFGAALSFAGKQLGIPVTIVMPQTVPKVKLDQVASHSATIVLKSTRPEEEKAAEDLAREKNLVQLSPYNHLGVIAGQGTIALEIYDTLPSIQLFFCQIGGGGLLSGCAAALKELNPAIKTIGVEPSLANDYFLSRKAGKKVRLEKVNTIADGLVAPEVGDLNYPILEKYVDNVEVIPDSAIIDAMRFLYEKMGMIIEPSGATSVAGLVAHPKSDLQGDIVCILSGANVDRDRFYSWMYPAYNQ